MGRMTTPRTNATRAHEHREPASGSPRALGSPLGDLALNAVGCAWSTCGAPMVTSCGSERRRAARGDTLVLSGHPTALALAEDKLLRGWHGSPAPALPAGGGGNLDEIGL